jgi:hypothetical protein
LAVVIDRDRIDALPGIQVGDGVCRPSEHSLCAKPGEYGGGKALSTISHIWEMKQGLREESSREEEVM